MYTQGDEGCKWIKAGQLRFIDLMKKMRNHHVEDKLKDKYKIIEQLILRREQAVLGIEVNSTMNMSNIDENSDDDNEEEEDMERDSCISKQRIKLDTLYIYYQSFPNCI